MNSKSIAHSRLILGLQQSPFQETFPITPKCLTYMNCFYRPRTVLATPAAIKKELWHELPSKRIKELFAKIAITKSR